MSLKNKLRDVSEIWILVESKFQLALETILPKISFLSLNFFLGKS